ncbi:MAG: glycosyltransferase [Spirochaetota bacterium]|nr:glycosyltransferase [Spirochaetota bacterium]
MLSIIIPTFNEEKYLPRLLHSIKSQDYKNYEIIISDANSEDNTKQVAKKNRCKFVSSKRRNPGHQRNNGAQKAKGDVLLFIDADAILPKNFLSTIMTEFTKKELDIAGFYFIFNSKKIIYKIYSFCFTVLCSFAQYVKPISIGAGILVKKRYHDSVDGFDVTIIIGEDHEYSQRISKIGKFRMITSKKMYYSVRRFEQEGKFITLFKWVYCAFYYLLKGPIRKRIVDYKFGNFS